MALARWLIGKQLVRRLDGVVMSGRIVETEAYLADDAASHSFRGPTPRNRSMFAERGHAYVYRIYGMWFCFNVSAGPEGHGAAVLIRALEPERGLEAMMSLRGKAEPLNATRGPGRLCVALGIGPDLDGVDLCAENGALWLADAEAPAPNILVTKRIGITKAADAALRFCEQGSLFLSGPASLRRA